MSGLELICALTIVAAMVYACRRVLANMAIGTDPQVVPSLQPFAALGMEVDGDTATRIELSTGMGPDFSARVCRYNGRWSVWVCGLPEGEFVRVTRFRWRAVRWCRAALREIGVPR
jgi:hypothetical protein